MPGRRHPESAAGDSPRRRQRDEGLGRGAILLPVLIVLIVGWHRPHPRGVEGKRRIPVGDRFLVRHPLDLGHERPVDGRAPHLRKARHPKRLRPLLHLAVDRLRQEEPHRETVADRERTALRRQVIGHPTADDDLVTHGAWQHGPSGVDKATARQRRSLDAEHGRIGNPRASRRAGALRQHVVGEKGERWRPATRAEHLPGREVDLLWDHEPPTRES